MPLAPDRDERQLLPWYHPCFTRKAARTLDGLNAAETPEPTRQKPLSAGLAGEFHAKRRRSAFSRWLLLSFDAAKNATLPFIASKHTNIYHNLSKGARRFFCFACRLRRIARKMVFETACACDKIKNRHVFVYTKVQIDAPELWGVLKM